MEKELQFLQENHTYDLVKLPQGKKALKKKWVYRLKTKNNSSQLRYKARLVVKDFDQKRRYKARLVVKGLIRRNVLPLKICSS